MGKYIPITVSVLFTTLIFRLEKLANNENLMTLTLFIIYFTTTHTLHIHNIQQQNSNLTQTHCESFHQTIHKHCQTGNTQDKQIH